MNEEKDHHGPAVGCLRGTLQPKQKRVRDLDFCWGKGKNERWMLERLGGWHDLASLINASITRLCVCVCVNHYPPTHPTCGPSPGLFQVMPRMHGRRIYGMELLQRTGVIYCSREKRDEIVFLPKVV